MRSVAEESRELVGITYSMDRRRRKKARAKGSQHQTVTSRLLTSLTPKPLVREGPAANLQRKTLNPARFPPTKVCVYATPSTPSPSTHHQLNRRHSMRQQTTHRIMQLLIVLNHHHPIARQWMRKVNL